MCQLLTPTARPARSYAPVVSDSLRPPGRLGDVSELWLALLKTQGEMWWPRLAGTLPGGARPSKAGRVPQHLPAPFGAGPKGSVRAHRTQRAPALSGFSDCPALRWNSNLERDRTPFPANSVFASVSGTNRLRGLAPTNAVVFWTNCWRRGNARRSNNATSSSRAPRTTSPCLVGFLPCADAQNVI